MVQKDIKEPNFVIKALVNQEDQEMEMSTTIKHITTNTMLRVLPTMVENIVEELSGIEGNSELIRIALHQIAAQLEYVKGEVKDDDTTK